MILDLAKNAKVVLTLIRCDVQASCSPVQHTEMVPGDRLVLPITCRNVPRQSVAMEGKGVGPVGARIEVAIQRRGEMYTLLRPSVGGSHSDCGTNVRAFGIQPTRRLSRII